MKKPIKSKELNETSVLSNPLSQFSNWMKEAIAANLFDPSAMILATSGKRGIPSARVVLLKEFDENGFVFFTNYGSAKASDLNINPKASLLFFWEEFERQVRIIGKVKKVSKAESEKYFSTRPRESQLGAWASNQSKVIASREVLDNKFEEMKKKFYGMEIPLPPFWGGFRVIPNKFEFWQGRENRLHDRICYSRKKNSWKIERLSP